jgi:hypothetical protein
MITRIFNLSHTPNAVLVEFPGISGHAIRGGPIPYPTASEVTASVRSHLASSIAPSSMVIGIAHSFGTMVLSTIMNSHPSTFQRTVYLDPVSFFPGATSLWPSLYSKLSVPVFMSCLQQLDLIKFVTHLAAGDVYTQHVIKSVQQFAEYANRENDDRPLVVLSGKDHLVDSRAVECTVKEGTTVWFYEGFGHGDVIVRGDFHRRLAEWIEGTW